MNDFWDKRYKQKEFAYGKEPNQYLKEKLANIETGKLLLPAEGEGRNAVYSAQLGWDVTAFDTSMEGKIKALDLAKQKNVSIAYHTGELPELKFDDEKYDVIALIFAHFPPNLKSKYHQLLSSKLKKGGYLIFEAFSKNHLEYQQKNEGIGGPKDLETLFSKEEVKSDFKNYEILELEEKEIELSEGLYHNGIGSVVRFFGKKL